MLCGESTIVKATGAEITATTLKCKCWSCDPCADINRARVIREAKAGEPTMFLTLTVDPKRFGSPDERARKLSRAWSLIRRRAMRKYSYAAIPFIAVFEATKRGEPHLHILLRCKWLGARWLSGQMKALTGAEIVKVEAINQTGNVANYIAKYLGKDLHRFEGCRRYWSTRDFKHPHPEAEEEDEPDRATYRIHHMNVAAFVQGARSRGFVVLGPVQGGWKLKYDYWASLRPLGGVQSAA